MKFAYLITGSFPAPLSFFVLLGVLISCAKLVWRKFFVEKNWDSQNPCFGFYLLAYLLYFGLCLCFVFLNSSAKWPHLLMCRQTLNLLYKLRATGKERGKWPDLWLLGLKVRGPAARLDTCLIQAYKRSRHGIPCLPLTPPVLSLRSTCVCFLSSHVFRSISTFPLLLTRLPHHSSLFWGTIGSHVCILQPPSLRLGSLPGFLQ